MRRGDLFWESQLGLIFISGVLGLGRPYGTGGGLLDLVHVICGNPGLGRPYVKLGLGGPIRPCICDMWEPRPR